MPNRSEHLIESLMADDGADDVGMEDGGWGWRREVAGKKVGDAPLR